MNLMLSSTAKGIIIFIVGGATGGLVSYKRLKSRFDQQLDEEINNTREYFLNAQKEGLLIKEYKDSEISRADSDDIAFRSDSETIDYTSYYKGSEKPLDPAESEHPTEDDDDYHEGKRISEDSNQKGIYNIDRDDYITGYPHFEKMEYTYWVYDNVLSDEEEREIDNLGVVVGDILTNTGFVDNPEIADLYIRNFDLGCDICIIKMFASYSENVALSLERI